MVLTHSYGPWNGYGWTGVRRLLRPVCSRHVGDIQFPLTRHNQE